MDESVLPVATIILQTSTIKDVSNNGYYHNMKFKEMAEAHGLHIEQHATYCWTITTLTEETAAWLATQLGMDNMGLLKKAAKLG